MADVQPIGHLRWEDVKLGSNSPRSQISLPKLSQLGVFRFGSDENRDGGGRPSFARNESGRISRFPCIVPLTAGFHSRGLKMIAALETFRAVICHRCAKPIRVPQKLENRAVHRASEGKDIESQVFVLRCGACERESVHSVSQIVDFPKSRARRILASR